MEKSNQKFSLKSRVASFKYAINGFRTLLEYEHNARVHLLFTVFVIIVGFLLGISALEWALIVFAIGFVFVAEVFNTCVEEICNFICPEQNSKIKKVKDLAALAVLLSAVTAVTVGLLILVPKVIALILK
ncbi:diacylglycerol kinase family protein [Pedobacter arcticus]|uniref:diacylglycerol kinase family protein n=1 Tax=Pedobacter arcticus TaxID=752140 RepID=UPI0003717594|nr:diacylglycerol kinase family protein [Pedobacter arcticus]